MASHCFGIAAVFAVLLPLYSQTVTEREQALLDRIERLEKRLAELEARVGVSPQPTAPPAEEPETHPPEVVYGVLVDSYYGYNFNHPVGRVNLLRVYDVLSNSFSLGQAAIVIQRIPNPAAGRRFGVRVDLQYGQATETLQGNPNNEFRPQVYRHLFQAYGTYIAPLGRGLSTDFGKWASTLGFEGNYVKDQWNYSRSYLFSLSPFYHFGFRTNYPFTDRFSLGYWLVNGAGQSEDFNNFKSQAVTITLNPKKVKLTLNYYTGVEGADVVPMLNPGFPTLPTQPGLSTEPVTPAPNGRRHIIDAYGVWQASPNLQFAAQGDYVINRLFNSSAPTHVTGVAGYARYGISSKWAVAGRAEYLSDRGGFFSGVTQALKETTLTLDYRVADSFLLRGEWRRDFSNVPFFLTSQPNVLKTEQNTATLGLIWWFGTKTGVW